MHMQEPLQEFSARQQEILAYLTRLPTPPAPALPIAALRIVPRWVRLLPAEGAAGVVIAFLLLLQFSHGMIPVHIDGPLTLKAGSCVDLMMGNKLVMPLPDGQGTLTVHGPTSLEVKQIKRSIFSGKLEADFFLKQGELLLDVNPAVPKLIRIETPLAHILVTGTAVLVGHLPEQGTRILVLHGHVQVKTAREEEWEILPKNIVMVVAPDGKVLRESTSLQNLREELNSPASLDSGEIEKLSSLLWHEMS